MGSGCGQGNGSANGNHAPTNLAFAKFLFLIARTDDDAHGDFLTFIEEVASRHSAAIVEAFLAG